MDGKAVKSHLGIDAKAAESYPQLPRTDAKNTESYPQLPRTDKNTMRRD